MIVPVRELSAKILDFAGKLNTRGVGGLSVGALVQGVGVEVVSDALRWFHRQVLVPSPSPSSSLSPSLSQPHPLSVLTLILIQLWHVDSPKTTPNITLSATQA